MSETQNNHNQSALDSQTWQDKAIFWAIAVAFFVLLFSVVTISAFNIWQVIDRPKPQADSSDAQAILDRANDAVDSASLVLSFLEGASVIVAVALGAAAFYGYRETQQLRQELTDKLKEIDLRSIESDKRLERTSQSINETLGLKLKEIDESLREIQNIMPRVREFLVEAPALLETHDTLKTTIDDVALLLQADQEFRNRNFGEAYEFSAQVLADDPDNILALYISGWIEVHHLENALDSGIEHLHMAYQLSDRRPYRWQTARATYGVALRRKAMKVRDTDPQAFANLMNKAEGHLRVALGENPRLVDFNRESFWGPMGGLQRDTNRIDEAVLSYQQALSVTPGSSYPQGNLSALYLFQVKHRGLDENVALDAFEVTRNGAQMRVATTPNDFFLLMDIAMSSTILLRRDSHPDKIRAAQQVFNRALSMQISKSQREVNCRGWCFLLENCPETESWAIVRQELQSRVDTMPCNCKKGE
ncbi:MAG: hypothetical protein H6673_05210 [Anaerolineales bacterium]|nr:hypothetical protein [Anaerolineales bacterium]